MLIRSLALVVGFALCCSAFAPGVSHGAVARCYGAASRDPLRPCANPALRLRVTPSPTQALLVPNAPCWPLPGDDVLRPCWFGASRRQAQAQVALLGDSHAMAWRAALAPVARRLGWHGTSITQSQCAFSRVVTPATEAPARRMPSVQPTANRLVWQPPRNHDGVRRCRQRRAGLAHELAREASGKPGRHCRIPSATSS